MFKVTIETSDGSTEKFYIEKEEDKDTLVASYLANPNNKVTVEAFEVN